MDPGQIGVFIPIVAIVMGVGSGMLKMWTKHQLDMAQVRAGSRSELDQSAIVQLEALRNEIAQLRDTTTKYDMSVESALEEVRHRLTTLETKNRVTYQPPAEQSRQVASVAINGGDPA